ncbi:MAG TPA: hypothetical protein VKI44_17155 [Acetobacteraceae bacterium]|nr:hypothetical protein [Acetobacteraceae bacterium]
MVGLRSSQNAGTKGRLEVLFERRRSLFSVLTDRTPMTPLFIPRARGVETALELKAVMVGDWGAGSKPRRYVVSLNPDEAKRDAAARAAILDSLLTALQHTKRFVLRPPARGCAGSVFPAIGVALPPLVCQLPPAIPPPAPPPAQPLSRRGRPRRGATSR